jgi:hypothetical protein
MHGAVPPMTFSSLNDEAGRGKQSAMSEFARKDKVK